MKARNFDTVFLPDNQSFRNRHCNRLSENTITALKKEGSLFSGVIGFLSYESCEPERVKDKREHTVCTQKSF